MNRVELLKLAYARGAFLALREAGYQEKVAEDLALKIAERDAMDVLEDVGIGAGIGGLGGAALGAGGGALASRLMGESGAARNLMTNMPVLDRALPGLGSAVANPGAIQARLHAAGKIPQMKGEVLQFLRENPTAASALFGGGAGAGLGSLAGGTIGGLAGE